LRQEGAEYGSTTGRPRRCGWFDAVVGRYSVRVNGLTRMALTKLDTLTGLDPIRICVGYRRGSRTLVDFPSDLSVVEGSRPVYEDLPGWKESIQDARSLSDLPGHTVRYIRRLEELLGVPFYFVSVGPQRQQSIVLQNPLED